MKRDIKRMMLIEADAKNNMVVAIDRDGCGKYIVADNVNCANINVRDKTKAVDVLKAIIDFAADDYLSDDEIQALITKNTVIAEIEYVEPKTDVKSYKTNFIHGSRYATACQVIDEYNRILNDNVKYNFDFICESINADTDAFYFIASKDFSEKKGEGILYAGNLSKIAEEEYED